MSDIAFLGLGAMGCRMATRLLEAGHRVTVWNRTRARTEPLIAAGARAAELPREAAAGAELVFSMLRDVDASRQVWLDPETGAIGGLAANSIAVECSTVTAQWVRQLAQAASGVGAGFVEAPVAGSRPQAEAGQLIFVAGGASDVLERVRPVLAAMGGAVHHAGDIGAGATVKLAVNGMLAVQAALLVDLWGFMTRSGMDPAAGMAVLQEVPVTSPAAKGLLGAMLARRFEPQFPVELVEKDLGYLLGDEPATHGRNMPVVAGARQRYAAAMAAGLGHDNISGIVRLLD